MRQEMRKLNRAKYACSEEEVKRLTAEGYVPVGKKAVPDKDKKPKKQAAAPDQEDNGAERPAAAPDLAGADEDGNKK